MKDVRADLSTRNGVRELWNSVEGLGRPLDLACLNAGVGVGGLFWETDLEEELKMVELHCVGAVQLAKDVVQHMRPLGAGKILSTASIVCGDQGVCSFICASRAIRAARHRNHCDCAAARSDRR